MTQILVILGTLSVVAIVLLTAAVLLGHTSKGDPSPGGQLP